MAILCDKCRGLDVIRCIRAIRAKALLDGGAADTVSLAPSLDEEESLSEDTFPENGEDPGSTEASSVREADTGNSNGNSGTPNDKNDAFLYDWHHDLRSINVSAATCELCALVMKGWRASRLIVIETAIGEAMFAEEPADLRLDITDIDAYYGDATVTLEVQRKEKDGDDGRGVNEGFALWIEINPLTLRSWEAHGGLVAEFRIAAQHQGVGTLLSTTGRTILLDELVDPNPLSRRALSVASSWLDTCVHEHGGSCSAPQPDTHHLHLNLPTRLLDAGDPALLPSSTIFLRESRDLLTDDALEARRFVALSHCWGTGKQFTTTTDTYLARTQGIEIDEMPQTFKDAVVICRALRLRYLWIDSLCIKQDDGEDWTKEAALMTTIYLDAHMVLLAANSDSDTKGFLRSRIMEDIVVLPLQPQREMEQHDKEVFHVGLHLLPAHSPSWTMSEAHDLLEHEPISLRAWCDQERILPRRALHFGSSQMFWECQRMRASEEGDFSAQDGSHLDRLCHTSDIPSTVFARSSDNRGGYSEESAGLRWHGWYMMLENYTARLITKHTDRFPAVGGLAKEVARFSGGEYMAGLWKSGLLEGLMWTRTSREQVLPLPPCDDYIAPSWSWASVAGQVQFALYHWYSRARWKANTSNFEPLATYIDHSLQLLDQEPFGRLKGGRLRLRAPLLKVVSVEARQVKELELLSHWGQMAERSPVADRTFRLGHIGKKNKSTIWIEGGFDRPDEEPRNVNDLYIVFLTRLPHLLDEAFTEQRFGLIVADTGDGQYRRVGFADGFILGEVHGPLVKWVLKKLDKPREEGAEEKYGTIAYSRPHSRYDLSEVDPPNKLAYDPLKLDTTEITLI